MTTVRDRREIARWAAYLSDLPLAATKPAPADVQGADADGLRFVLRDGSTYELTQLFLGPNHNVLIWPDGRIAETRFGAPSGYTSGELVDPGARPDAVIR